MKDLEVYSPSMDVYGFILALIVALVQKEFWLVSELSPPCFLFEGHKTEMMLYIVENSCSSPIPTSNCQVNTHLTQLVCVKCKFIYHYLF